MNNQQTGVRQVFAHICGACLVLGLCAVIGFGVHDLVAFAQAYRHDRYQAAGHVAQRIEPIPPVTGEVKVNSLNADGLTVLPGIGPAYAQAIVDERETNGPFFYPEDLLSVRGIGVKRLEAILGLIDLTCPDAP